MGVVEINPAKASLISGKKLWGADVKVTPKVKPDQITLSSELGSLRVTFSLLTGKPV